MKPDADTRVEEGQGVQDNSRPRIRIAAICGSLQPNGATKMALSLALKGASEYDASTNLVELRDYDLGFYGKADGAVDAPDATRLRGAIRESQGIILGSPEYHGSLSGALKNMFDLMSIEDFEGKIIGLVGVAGGHIGAINTLNTMRTIGRNMHCWVLPQDVSVAQSARTFNQDGTVNDLGIEHRLRDIGRQVVKFATLQQKVKHDGFMKYWEGLPTW
jgi:NAD(P)H-dependent FMN reductase